METAAEFSSRLFRTSFFLAALWPRSLQKSALSLPEPLFVFWTFAICSALIGTGAGVLQQQGYAKKAIDHYRAVVHRSRVRLLSNINTNSYSIWCLCRFRLKGLNTIYLLISCKNCPPFSVLTCSCWEWCPSPAAGCLCPSGWPASFPACHHIRCPPPWRSLPGRRRDSEAAPSHTQNESGWKMSPLDRTPRCLHKLGHKTET